MGNAGSCHGGCFAGLSRRRRGIQRDAFQSEDFHDAMDDDDWQREREAVLDRGRLLSLVEENTPEVERTRIGRFYSMENLKEITEFRTSFMADIDEQRLRLQRLCSLPGEAPWGNPTARGGAKNAWDDNDATSYNVRGSAYLKDKRKAPSLPASCNLLCVDFFECNEDVKNVAACDAEGIVRRVRRAGETRRLVLVNFRIVPLHLVAVWAIPDDETETLLSSFFSSMRDDERNKRLKIIPRVVEGPWVVRRLLGDPGKETPAILGKKVPVDYYSTPGEFEISVGVGGSSYATRIVNVCKYAAAALIVEVNFTIEASAEHELPERIFGGFRITFPDVASFRKIVQDS